MNTADTQPGHFTTDRYFELGECGILAPDDRVELLDGLIVAMPPPTPLHDSAVQRGSYALLRGLGLGGTATVRVQSTFLVGSDSALLPDLAVVPRSPDDYATRHPTRAHLVVEVALSSLPQDRLTKSAIYARAGVPCYWIVNLREGCVEVYRDLDRWKAEYRSVTRAVDRNPLVIDDFPGLTFRAADFLPVHPGA
jgi:Uma2 family endonuclease